MNEIELIGALLLSLFLLAVGWSLAEGEEQDSKRWIRWASLGLMVMFFFDPGVLTGGVLFLCFYMLSTAPKDWGQGVRWTAAIAATGMMVPGVLGSLVVPLVLFTGR